MKKKPFKKLWEKDKFWQPDFLGPLAVGQRTYVMARPSVNFYFRHLLWNYLSDFDEISQKYSCHGPLQNLLKEFDFFKNSGCHGNKT